jgi:hypothetical protein
METSMENALYDNALAALKTLFGMPRPLVNKTGARFLRNGTVTIYHDELSPGNSAEIAFNVQPIATSYNIQPATLSSLLDECRKTIGRPTEVNKQQNWPRLAIATEQDLHLIVEKLSALLKR